MTYTQMDGFWLEAADRSSHIMGCALATFERRGLPKFMPISFFRRVSRFFELFQDTWHSNPENPVYTGMIPCHAQNTAQEARKLRQVSVRASEVEVSTHRPSSCWNMSGIYPQYSWDFPKEILKNSRDPGNTLKACPGTPLKKVRLGTPKPYTSSHLNAQERSRILSPSIRLGTPLFSEVVP